MINVVKSSIMCTSNSRANGLFQCHGQLVGTRCVFVSASDALQLGCHIGSFHASHECGYALQVAVTTTQEANVDNHTVFIQFKINLRRAGALWIISIFHFLSLLLKQPVHQSVKVTNVHPVTVIVQDALLAQLVKSGYQGCTLRAQQDTQVLLFIT